jgi:hypothetical protein
MFNKLNKNVILMNNKYNFLRKDKLLKQFFSIFVKTQQTPNPNFLKFFPGKELFQDGETYDFSNMREAANSPLARKLFDINGVTRVFYGKDYISVGKKELTEWNDVKPFVVDTICDYFTKNIELFEEKPEAEDTQIKETDNETIALIKEIISTRVRPVVQEDGGDIKFINFDADSGTVLLAMKGS